MPSCDVVEHSTYPINQVRSLSRLISGRPARSRARLDHDRLSARRTYDSDSIGCANGIKALAPRPQPKFTRFTIAPEPRVALAVWPGHATHSIYNSDLSPVQKCRENVSICFQKIVHL